MDKEHNDNCSCCSHGEIKVRRRSEEDLKKIAQDLAGGKVFCDKHLVDSEKEDLMGKIFAPIRLGYFNNWSEEEFKKVGMIFQYLEHDVSRIADYDEGAIELPVFLTIEVMHVDDMEDFMRFGKEILDESNEE